MCIPEKDSTKNDTPDDGGLYPIDILDPSLYVPLHVVYYYHNLIWYLKKHNYEAAKTLFGFGYDFRQSNMKHLDDLIARLEAASAANNGVKCATVGICFALYIHRHTIAVSVYCHYQQLWGSFLCSCSTVTKCSSSASPQAVLSFLRRLIDGHCTAV